MNGRPYRIRPPSEQESHIATGMKLYDWRRKLDVALHKHNMATVIWGGDRFPAKPISQNPDGSWLMEAQQRTARTVLGTRFTVQPDQIVTMPETPQTPAPQTAAPAPNGKSSMSSRLSEKAKLVAGGQKSLLVKMDAQFDAMLEAQAKAAERLGSAVQKINANQADIDSGTAVIEDLANQLTNS